MSHNANNGLVVLWSADAGTATREIRITRTTAAACLVLVGALLGVCLWLGWELGHWSAKAPTAFAQVDVVGETRAG